MMKLTTINKLKDLAKVLATSFVFELKHDMISRNDIYDMFAKTKHKSEIEVIKTMFRHDCSKYGFTDIFANIMKTSEQFNFLAIEILSEIKHMIRTVNKSGQTLPNVDFPMTRDNKSEYNMYKQCSFDFD